MAVLPISVIYQFMSLVLALTRDIIVIYVSALTIYRFLKQLKIFKVGEFFFHTLFGKVFFFKYIEGN